MSRVRICLVKKIVPMDQDPAEKAALLFSEIGSRRTFTADSMVAGAAIQWGAGLLTASRDDFVRLERQGLKLLTP